MEIKPEGKGISIIETDLEVRLFTNQANFSGRFCWTKGLYWTTQTFFLNQKSGIWNNEPQYLTF